MVWSVGFERYDLPSVKWTISFFLFQEYNSVIISSKNTFSLEI